MFYQILKCCLTAVELEIGQVNKNIGEMPSAYRETLESIVPVLRKLMQFN